MERELPASALSQIKAEDMPEEKIDWDGEPLKEHDDHGDEGISFTPVSISIIFIVLLAILTFILYVLRKFIIK